MLYFSIINILGKNLPKKICAKCKRDLSVKEYNPTKTGAPRGACKKCENAQRNEHVSSSPYAYINRIFSKLKSARQKEEKPFAWEIEIDHVKELWDLQQGECALSGVYLTWQAGEGRQEHNISIDRKDPNKGYVVGNVQLVAFRVNVMKHTLGESDFYWWCKNVVAKKEQF